MQKFNALAKEGLTNVDSPGEPHPSASLIVELEADELEEKTAQNIRAHLLYCKTCREKYLLLRKLSQEQFEEHLLATDGPSWLRMLVKALEFVIDLGKTYGPGSLIGSIRVLAEQPAVAVRGGGTSTSTSKVLEVSVGENTYSIQVGATENDALSCDVAGVHTPVKTPLGVSVFSESGGELVSTKTDEFGNVHFVLPSVHDDLLLLVLNLKGEKQEVLLRIPESKKPA